MITVDGVITAWTVTPASSDERETLWDLTEGVRGLVIGDKGYISAFLKTELATAGIDLQTPLRANMTDPRPPWVVQQRMRTRRRVETVIGQLTEQFHFEKVRARDVWHLTSRMARKVSSCKFSCDMILGILSIKNFLLENSHANDRISYSGR